MEQVIIGLATGLGQLSDGNEEYFFLLYPDESDWLRPYLNERTKVLFARRKAPRHAWKDSVGRFFPLARWAWRVTRSAAGRGAVRIPVSDGTVESAGIEVMHFATQEAFLTEIPSIYHPHDLLHLHRPEYFSHASRTQREVKYRRFCEMARIVATTSSWIRADVIKQYRLDESKVKVIPFAPVLDAYPVPTEAALADTRKKFSLPGAFLFYPAQTWQNKNHIGLLDALAILRDRHGLSVPLVCSGRMNSFYARIQKHASKLRLENQVRFLGFVSPLELQSLYRLCRGVVIPTKFEAASFPLWEAFLASAPVACSNATSLPRQAAGAALLFDPERPTEIARAIEQLWTDEELRRHLVRKGRQNVQRFSWDRTARTFRAHYHAIAKRPLSDEDRALLQAEPLL